ncbi:Sua5/YciO/YrdC/YwlC family protein [Parahaliea sp. F7430]|uniref:Threonylcarbamoyl-AMP synthase n=1 Tax=Sediminihaliea albiluteola TaxID=2758564 RepID=A0A7W2TXK6_9GAMM|nr:Sua5/YciO/YrdC/YwlC family protein [Sediminihaliea albiluteola]MBA6413802.1 Sua5/YciO/YrdC/YwlC family protein [Sediminihaliea albiluteola]
MAISLRLQTALRALQQGAVVACPTEAVWGLSCDPDNSEAVQRLLDLKRRPMHKGLILVASESEQFAALLQGLSQAQRSKLSLSWPGATTWLVPHHDLVPAWIHGGRDSVALRVSAHPVLAALCRHWGGPLVSTSANPSGSQAPRAAFQVRRYFGANVEVLLPGAVGGADRPSVIRDILTDRIIRS